MAILIGIEAAIFVIKALRRTGWVPGDGTLIDIAKALLTGKMQDLLKRYQSHFGLPTTGELDPATHSHILMPRICERHDIEAVEVAAARGPLIPGSEVRWWVRNGSDWRGLDWHTVMSCFDAAWNHLSSCCGITARNVATQAEANAIIEAKWIDGGYGTLAWSELANGSGQPLNQRYDTGDSWQYRKGTLPAGGPIDLYRVALHESIHLLGLPHDTIDMMSLMAPTYSLTVFEPTRRDIDRLQAIYGPPRPKRTPVPPQNNTPPEQPPATPVGPGVPPSDRAPRWTVNARLEQTPEGLTLFLPGVTIKTPE